jgi:hypothetical protein
MLLPPTLHELTMLNAKRYVALRDAFAADMAAVGELMTADDFDNEADKFIASREAGDTLPFAQVSDVQAA